MATNFSLLQVLVQRDLEARYKGSLLGNLWPLLNQITQLLVYTYVFSVVLKVKLSLPTLPDNDLTFGLWLFAGLTPWIAFASGLSQSAGVVISQPNLVKKVVFPLALLPLVPIFSAFIESLIGLFVLIVILLLINHSLPTTIGLLPLVWLPQLLITIGLGYLISGLTVFVRDIPQTIGVILNIWFYATPIIYPTSLIPEQFKFWVLWVNPLTAITESYRDLILSGQLNHSQELSISFFVSPVIFLVGLWVYQRLRAAFADVL